jgi:hypothetical protein
MSLCRDIENECSLLNLLAAFCFFWVWAADSGLMASTLPILLAVCRI